MLHQPSGVKIQSTVILYFEETKKELKKIKHFSPQQSECTGGAVSKLTLSAED